MRLRAVGEVAHLYDCWPPGEPHRYALGGFVAWRGWDGGGLATRGNLQHRLHWLELLCSVFCVGAVGRLIWFLYS